jgi:transcriptional regulator with XRE-family HTH domain
MHPGTMGISLKERKGDPVIVLRHVIGDELRRRRQDQGRTLRDVSATAAVSLGYLSEVERGQKEASSELLAAICEALDVSLADVLAVVSTNVARAEDREVPEPSAV